MSRGLREDVLFNHRLEQEFLKRSKQKKTEQVSLMSSAGAFLTSENSQLTITSPRRISASVSTLNLVWVQLQSFSDGDEVLVAVLLQDWNGLRDELLDGRLVDFVVENDFVLWCLESSVDV